MSHPRRLLAILGLLAAGTAAQEMPAPGLVFARWVRDTFFHGYKPANSSQRWDIPAGANPDHGGIPAALKWVRQGDAIDLGDALRQYEIDESFLLIVGIWTQEGDVKRITTIAAPEIAPGLWRSLWTPVTYADLLKFDARIKDTGRPVEEIRRLALKMISSPPFNQAVIQVNPKIGADGQRRLQCSLRFADLFRHLMPGTDWSPSAPPTLFGTEYPGGRTPPSRAPAGN